MSLPIFDAKSKGSTDYGGSVTSSHIIGSGTNRLLIAQCELPSLSDKVTGVTYNGVALTRFRRSGSPGVPTVYTYYLLNPPTGTANVVWSFATADCRASCINHSWSNVDQTTPLTFLSEIIDSVNNSDSRSFSALTSSQIALDFIGTNETGRATFTQGAGQTLIDGVIQNGQTVYEAVASYASGVSSVSDSWTDGLRSIGHVAIAINGFGAATNSPPTFSGTIANITGTNGSAITPVDVHTLFSDTDTLTYSASPAGTAWPSGLSINSSTGVISGTVATSTTTGLKVRATDTASQTVDSNAFSVTISAGAATVTGVTVSPATSTVVGGANQTFTATVTGTNSPAQTVTWAASPAGSITSGGVFTAPAATSSAQTITITATSTADNTKSGTATVTVPATSTSTSYVDMTTEKCDNMQSGLMAGATLNAVVFRRDDLTVAKQVVTGITTNTDSTVPRFQVALAVGTPVHIVFINAADNTQTGVVSDHVTVA